MHKVIVTGLAALACTALISGDALACGGSEASAKTDCTASKTTAQLAASKEAKAVKDYSGCAYSKGAATTARSGADDHARLCNYDGKCKYTTICVAGMTCGGCEKTVTAALESVSGIVKVFEVSHKDGVARVCYDPAKTSGELLTTAVANKGYQAQIVPALAKSAEGKDCSKLTAEQKAACKARGEQKAKTGAEGTH